MAAIFAAQGQKTVGQNATIEEGLKLVFDKVGQARAGLGLDLGAEALEVFGYQLVEDRLFWASSFVVDRIFMLGRCRLNRLTHGGLPYSCSLLAWGEVWPRRTLWAKSARLWRVVRAQTFLLCSL